MGFVVGRVALEQIFIRVVQISRVIIIPEFVFGLSDMNLAIDSIVI
jgi:hypothetical protein